MSEIQAKLFNTFLAWDNNEIVWSAETGAETPVDEASVGQVAVETFVQLELDCEL